MQNNQFEKDLVEQAKTNPKKFEELYDMYFSKIYNYVLARTNNRAETEDLTQEIFFSVF